jgi:hypothetical protein
MTKENVWLVKGFQDELRAVMIFEDILETLKSVWLKLCAPLLDLYFIGRMLKTPKNNVNSYLTLGFFGTIHTKNIVNFLTIQSDWYEVRYANDFQSTRQRCIPFTEVNFNSDLESYVTMRSRLQDLSPYMKQMEREILARKNPVSSLSQDLIASLIGIPIKYTKDAILLLNIIADKVILFMVRPSALVTVDAIIDTLSREKSPISDRFLDLIEYYDGKDYINPVLIQNMVARLVEDTTISEEAIDTVGYVILQVLSIVIYGIIEEINEDPDVIQRKDILRYLETDVLNEPPFGPFD